MGIDFASFKNAECERELFKLSFMVIKNFLHFELHITLMHLVKKKHPA